MASLIPLRMILPGAKKHLGTPRNARTTTRSDLLGWESRPALKPAPAGSPQPTGLLIRVTTWTAHLTPLRSSSCCPGWALDGSLVASPSLSRVTIGWWRWRRQTLSAGMTRLSAPLRVLLWPRNFVATPRRDLCWTCTLWISCLDAGHGPGLGSPRRLLHNFMTCKRAACQSLCDAFPARLLQRKPVRAEPGPKSGPCFDLTSLRALHQERGARVAGLPHLRSSGSGWLSPPLVRSHEVGSLFSYRASSQPQPAVLLTLVLHLRPSPSPSLRFFSASIRQSLSWLCLQRLRGCCCGLPSFLPGHPCSSG